MSIISQISMMILVMFIIILIKESNKQLTQAAREGGLFLEEEKVHTFQKEIEVKFQPENIVCATKKPGKKICLIFLDEHHYPSEKIEVDSLPFTIGRSKQNSLVLEDLCVARNHGEITEEGNEILLKDLGTANKIFASGKLCDEIILRDRERFYIGNQEFLVEMRGEKGYDTN